MTYKISIICSCYRGEKYLPLYLETYEKQTIFNDCELVLVHNDPTEKELGIINNFKNKYPNRINHIIVSREPISISMNRAILASKSDILINRDIDDLRTWNSLEIQYTMLANNSDCHCCYWDFIIVKEFGSYLWKYIHSIEFEANKFKQSMHCWPFRAWKKEIHEKIWYFDEQLKSWADFDLMIRIAYHYKMKKVNWNLWYYLNANTGLSTWANKFISLQEKELRVINERYHIYNKIDYCIKVDHNIYNINSIINNDIARPIKDIIPSLDHSISLRNEFLSFIFTILQWWSRIIRFFYLKYIA